MDLSSAVLALIPLVIDYAKERRHNSASLDEHEFRAWLENVGFKQLLEASGEAVRTISIGQKSHHAELLRYLDEQFSAIQSALDRVRVGQPAAATFEECWQRLGPTAHEVLATLLELAQGSNYASAQINAPIGLPNRSAEEIETARRRLVEANLTSFRSYAGGATLSLTGLGFLVASMANDAQAFQAALVSVQDGLRRHKHGPVDKFVAQTLGRCSTAFVYTLLERWDALGLISLQKLDQRERSRVNQVTQTLIDMTPESLRHATFSAFVTG